MARVRLVVVCLALAAVAATSRLAYARQVDAKAAAAAVKASPDLVKSLSTELGSTPEQMRDMIRQSLETWSPVVEAAKIVVE